MIRAPVLMAGGEGPLGEVAAAQAGARAALALGAEHPAYGASGALARVRETAADEVSRARLLLGIALSRGGEHHEALSMLERADHGHDEPALACLLRSEAAVRGPAVALERDERYRAELADRLGTDPGSELQRLHGELLAADRPVRAGVHFDATSLLGRDDDLRALRALVGSSRVTSIVGPVAWARPCWPTCWLGRPPSRWCTSSSSPGSRPRKTWSPSSAPPSACATR